MFDFVIIKMCWKSQFASSIMKNPINRTFQGARQTLGSICCWALELDGQKTSSPTKFVELHEIFDFAIIKKYWKLQFVSSIMENPVNRIFQGARRTWVFVLKENRGDQNYFSLNTPSLSSALKCAIYWIFHYWRDELQFSIRFNDHEIEHLIMH